MLPLPLIIVPIASTTMGNFAALSMFYSVLLTTFIFSVLTFSISFFLHRRKQMREELGLPFYSNKKTPHLIMVIGIFVVIVSFVAIVSLIIISERNAETYRQNAEMRRLRVIEYTTYTHIAEFYLTEEVLQKEFTAGSNDTLERIRIDSLERMRSTLIRGNSVTITSQFSQHNFETLFDKTLPEIDFMEYFYLVLVSQRYEFHPGRGWVTVSTPDDRVTVHQVNIVP